MKDYDQHIKQVAARRLLESTENNFRSGGIKNIIRGFLAIYGIEGMIHHAESLQRPVIEDEIRRYGLIPDIVVGWKQEEIFAILDEVEKERIEQYRREAEMK